MSGEMSAASPAIPRRLRVASVSFLNARPLIYGLENHEDLEMTLAVPSRLLELLRAAACDVALLPVIDYQRLAGLQIVPSGGIGCDGHTLTVRIFAQQPIAQTRVLACDPDSHTSVALARIILAERFGLRPEFIDLTRASGRPGEARLLIGDKVVCEEPVGLEHQLDLGHAWKEMTGLPFVFAVWTARAGCNLRDLPQRLQEAKQQGLAQVSELIQRYAVPRGWPPGVALQYLTVYLRYDIAQPQLRSIRLFHELAAKHGSIDPPQHELALYTAP
jgi:chorismate dehydratase